MRKILPPYFILLDLEYTAWEGSMARKWSGPGEAREIVEIGGIYVNAKTLEERGHIHVLVRPTKNPTLSEYFVNLTGITQEMIDAKGLSFAKALDALEFFTRRTITFSWGHDADVIQENCRLNGIPNPLRRSRFLDLRRRLTNSLAGIDVRAHTSGTLIRAFGKTGLPPHRALNDMRNLLAVLRELRMRDRL